MPYLLYLVFTITFPWSLVPVVMFFAGVFLARLPSGKSNKYFAYTLFAAIGLCAVYDILFIGKSSFPDSISIPVRRMAYPQLTEYLGGLLVKAVLAALGGGVSYLVGWSLKKLTMRGSVFTKFVLGFIALLFVVFLMQVIPFVKLPLPFLDGVKKQDQVEEITQQREILLAISKADQPEMQKYSLQALINIDNRQQEFCSHHWLNWITGKRCELKDLSTDELKKIISQYESSLEEVIRIQSRVYGKR